MAMMEWCAPSACAMTLPITARLIYATPLDGVAGLRKGSAMEIVNLGAADGLPPVNWADVIEKLDAGLPADLSAEHAGPECRQAARVAGVEAHRHQSQGHVRAPETTQDLRARFPTSARRVGVRRQGGVDAQALIAG
jgi:hypothetical protein